MGLFSFLRREKSNLPQTMVVTRKEEDPLSFDDFIDGFKDYVAKALSWSKLFLSGKDLTSVNRAPYSKISSVYKPVKAIVDNVPQAKIVAYNKDGDMVVVDAISDRFAMPSPGISYSEFISSICGYLALNGEAFIIIRKNTVGENAGISLPALIVVNPKNVSEVTDQNTGELKGWNIGKESYLPEDVIVIKDFNPENPHRGLSPALPLENEMAIDYFSILYNKKFFENDATPGVTLESEKSLTEDQIKQLREQWNEGSRGVNRAFLARVLNGGIKLKPMTQSHKEMDFVEQKKLVRDEITGNWRVPKSLFNVTDQINYATFQGQMKMFWQYQICPMLRKVEDSINMAYMARFMKAYKIGFDFKNVPAFSEDMKAKAETAQILYSMGFTRNEINEELELGFEEKPWGDEFWVPAGMAPASALGDSWTEPIDEEGKPKEEPQEPLDKALGKMFHVKHHQDAIMKGFLATHARLEIKMARKVKRHFYNLRKSILELPDSVLGDMKIDINWDQADQDIKRLTSGVLIDAVTAGIENAEMQAEKAFEGYQKKDISETQTLLDSYLALRVDKITGINSTVRKMLLVKIEKALRDGVITGGTMSEMATAVREVVRDYFNNAGIRAKLIARTEITGAMNGGALAKAKEDGFEKKEWLTANDEVVRESHRHCQDQGSIDIDDPFVNGLQNPGDQESAKPGEVCNCRCTILFS